MRRQSMADHRLDDREIVVWNVLVEAVILSHPQAYDDSGDQEEYQRYEAEYDEMISAEYFHVYRDEQEK